MNRLSGLFYLAFALPLGAAPPGASISIKLQVPRALQTGVFAQDHNLNLPPGFQIVLFAQVANARFLAVAPNGDVLVSQPDLGTITLLRPDPLGGVPKSFLFASGLNNPQGIVFHSAGGATYIYIS